jgi:hypothetical protein
MQDSGEKNGSMERERLWEEVQQNAAEIRRRVLTILEHPDTPAEFKKHSAVHEVVR